MKRFCSAFLLLFVFTLSSFAQGVFTLEPLPKDGSREIGFRSPRQIQLSAAVPSSLKKAPAFKAPLYGIIPLKAQGDRTFHVVVDEPSVAGSKLYVDSNGNGDLTDDPAADWKSSKMTNGYLVCYGGSDFSLSQGGSDVNVYFAMTRYDKNDPENARVKNAFLFADEYAWKGQVALGGTSYRAMIFDEKSEGDFGGAGMSLLLDRDANGSFHFKWEKFGVKEPFAIGGTTYEIASWAPMANTMDIRVSSATVAELKAPPDHRVGKPVDPFETMDMDGKAVKFPGDYRGKVVLLDFWATWCGPCMDEMPGLVAAYAKYKSKGLEILGVSLDSQGQDAKLRTVMKASSMTWRQVFEGKGWKGDISVLYGIDSIPAPYLIDGDTGEILDLWGNLRGKALLPAIEKALRKKGKL